MEPRETFNYTYSAKQQEEIKRIRKKYALTDEEDKMAKLRKLDAGVYQKASTVALIVGIVGALLLGLGMSLVMTDIDKILGSLSDMGMLIGVIIGIIGILIVCLAYPIYEHILKKERERVAPEIIRLTDELLK